MANTSGSAAFNLDLSDLIEEAFERCGAELRTGYDMRTARRSINLLTIEWANRGINLWTIEQGQIVMNTGQICYPFPADTIDLLDHVTRTEPVRSKHHPYFRANLLNHSQQECHWSSNPSMG